MKLTVTFSEGQAFSPLFSDTGMDLAISFGESFTSVQAEVFGGEYSIVPRVFEQEVPCSGKLMARNLTVTEIPYSATSNPKGGYTVNIGG